MSLTELLDTHSVYEMMKGSHLRKIFYNKEVFKCSLEMHDILRVQGLKVSPPTAATWEFIQPCMASSQLTGDKICTNIRRAEDFRHCLLFSAVDGGYQFVEDI
jgi:hypothetical protein